jgi:ATP-binding cassette subfamily B (MDR/TAP) protein 1
LYLLNSCGLNIKLSTISGSTPYIGCSSWHIYDVYVRATVQEIGMGFTYGPAICSCALKLWVGRHLIACGKADGFPIKYYLYLIYYTWFVVVWTRQLQTSIHLSKGGLLLIDYEMINCLTVSTNLEGTSIRQVQGNIKFRNMHFSYLSRPG